MRPSLRSGFLRTAWPTAHCMGTAPGPLSSTSHLTFYAVLPHPRLHQLVGVRLSFSSPGSAHHTTPYPRPAACSIRRHGLSRSGRRRGRLRQPRAWPPRCVSSARGKSAHRAPAAGTRPAHPVVGRRATTRDPTVGCCDAACPSPRPPLAIAPLASLQPPIASTAPAPPVAQAPLSEPRLKP